MASAFLHIGLFPQCSLKRSNVLVLKIFCCAAPLAKFNLVSLSCQFYSVTLVSCLVLQKPPSPLSLSSPKLLLRPPPSGTFGIQGSEEKQWKEPSISLPIAILVIVTFVLSFPHLVCLPGTFTCCVYARHIHLSEIDSILQSASFTGLRLLWENSCHAAILSYGTELQH